MLVFPHISLSLLRWLSIWIAVRISMYTVVVRLMLICSPRTGLEFGDLG